MNDRIKELAGKALDKAVPKTWTTLTAYDLDKFTEKFAELLIQECLLALEPDLMAPAIDYDVEEKFYKRSADKIKKHFGIK